MVDFIKVVSIGLFSCFCGVISCVASENSSDEAPDENSKKTLRPVSVNEAFEEDAVQSNKKQKSDIPLELSAAEKKIKKHEERMKRYNDNKEQMELASKSTFKLLGLKENKIVNYMNMK